MTLHIGMMPYPRMTQLDMTGPFEVLARIPSATVHLAWKTRDPVTADTGLSVVPTTTFEDCPALDVVCVPGGPGQLALMADDVVHAWLRKQAATARYVTSVCTGALILGAAGLLNGYKATTHWAYHEMLSAFGAEPVRDRVVIDRDRVTGGGVTAGIDFGLRLAAELASPEIAQSIQLGIEYDPAPPFDAGHPDRAPKEIVEMVKTRLASVQ